MCCKNVFNNKLLRTYMIQFICTTVDSFPVYNRIKINTTDYMEVKGFAKRAAL